MKTKTQPLESVYGLHPITRDAINKAVAMGIVTAVEVAVMSTRNGADNVGWLEELCKSARGRKDCYAAMCRYSDAYHAVD